MAIGIIDADLIGRKKHRFPNLACEKISGYWKELGEDVELKLDYENLDIFDHVYVSKVFTDTLSPEWLEEKENIHLGGTGFFFDKAPDLEAAIEHHMPDYHLYDEWIELQIQSIKDDCQKKKKPFNESEARRSFKEYTDYSIGFMTRGCFRKCKFCVNQKYDTVFKHSELEEFLDESRKKICLLDDNFFGNKDWQKMMKKLESTGKAFKFKQGIDERLLTEKKCEILFNAKYDGDYTFAFDNIDDYDLIHRKLKMIRKHTNSTSVKFYVLVGFEGTDEKDIENAFKRITLLMKYKALPYIMRYQDKNVSPWKESEYRGMYVTLARWCNQPSIFKKMSFRQFCEANQALHKTEGTLCSSMFSMNNFELKYYGIAKKFFDLRYEDYK